MKHVVLCDVRTAVCVELLMIYQMTNDDRFFSRRFFYFFSLQRCYAVWTARYVDDNGIRRYTSPFHSFESFKV